uniref:F-box domain-containing protein n=1 Tax=viral metagenome TaxID=1070528 RepID=A0A6C0CA92_9ZZZZ
MDHILYDDIFEELKQWLRPIDLYNLVQTCKSYRKMITMKDIKTSTIHEIDRRLCAIFGSDYDKFELVLKNSNAVVVGSLITQCILGEKWDDDIHIIVDSNELNYSFNETTRKFMFQEEDYKPGNVSDMKIIEYISLKFGSNFIFDTHHKIYNVALYIRGKNIMIDDISQIVYKERQKYDICKNTYRLGESLQYMHIHQINKIFTKHTNFYPDCALHKKYKARGFSFYDADDKIMPDRDIWRKMNIDIIKVTPCDNKSPEERLQILTKQEHGYVHKNYILVSGSSPEEDLYSVYRYPTPQGYIVSCFGESKKDCLFQEMYSGVEHLHYFYGINQTLFVINTCTDVNDPTNFL